MPLWAQHLLVIVAAAACAAVVLRQAVRTLKGKANALGKCCAKGCPPANGAGSQSSSNRVVFFPAELLTRRKPK